MPACLSALFFVFMTLSVPQERGDGTAHSKRKQPAQPAVRKQAPKTASKWLIDARVSQEFQVPGKKKLQWFSGTVKRRSGKTKWEVLFDDGER